MRVVMVVVLQTGAKGRHHRQPIADVHRIVAGIVIAARAEASIVSPEILNQIHPKSEHADAAPQHKCVFPVPHQRPNKDVADDLRQNREQRLPDHAKRPGFQDRVAGHVLPATVGHEAKIRRFPEAVGGELVRIAGVVGEAVMIAVTIDPADRIHVDAEGVVEQHERLDERRSYSRARRAPAPCGSRPTNRCRPGTRRRGYTAPRCLLRSTGPSPPARIAPLPPRSAARIANPIALYGFIAPLPIDSAPMVPRRTAGVNACRATAADARIDYYLSI